MKRDEVATHVKNLDEYLNSQKIERKYKCRVLSQLYRNIAKQIKSEKASAVKKTTGKSMKKE